MNNNIFAELQALSQDERHSEIDDCRIQLNKLIDFMEHIDYYEQQLKFFADFRKLKVETLKAVHGFMCEEDTDINIIPEEFQHDSLGFCRGPNLIYRGRFVYPVYDVHNNAMGLCGYDKFIDPKYLDSSTYGYKAKAFSCYGMEKLLEYYKSNEPVFFVEGIVCCLAIREADMLALAMLGSQLSPYMIQILKRFGRRAIVIPDADEAGSRLRKRLSYIAPSIRCVQSRVAKDIDDSRLKEPKFLDELRKLKNPYYLSSMLQ